LSRTRIMAATLSMASRPMHYLIRAGNSLMNESS